jgi:endoglucanase
MLTDDDRAWLEALTHLPTVAGREEAVIAFVERWAAERDGVAIRRDASGNLILSGPHPPRRPPLWITAHLDHPGFMADDGGMITFRGGMGAPYFEGGPAVEFFPPDEAPIVGTLTSWDADAGVGTVDVDVPPGTIGRWHFDPADLGITDGVLRAPGCDDLAGVAAALSVLERTRSDPDLGHVGLLLTRAEEVGFVGAIAACVDGTIAPDARLICLETSRAFDWAPIGAGPVVRVGDRVSVFTPELTDRVSVIAGDLDRPTQRKLMDGGACEATAFVAHGFAATCICLPLGNYHNQGDLPRVEAGEVTGVPAPEYIALDDHEGLVELLVAVARRLDEEVPPLTERLAARFEAQRHLLVEEDPARGGAEPRN